MRADFKRQLSLLLGDTEAPSTTQQKFSSAVKNNILGKIGQNLKPEQEQLTGNVTEQMSKLNEMFRDVLQAQTKLAAEVRAKN